jgi:hypothetical protein
MEILFSNIYNIKKVDTSPNVEMTAISNFFIKKLGFQTTFFGDKKSLELYKNIEFDNFKLIPESFINSLPYCFWSMSKLYAIRQTNNPCLHIDSDLFITKPFPENFLENDIVCFHNEKFAEQSVKILQNLIDIKPKECEQFPIISYNCGIIGGQDIKTLHMAIDILFNFLIKNKLYLDNIAKKFNHKDYPEYRWLFYPPVLFEQIWLFQIFKFFKKNINELIKDMKNWDHSLKFTKKTGYFHLMMSKMLYEESWGKNILYKYNIKY